ncbi:MAG TPA: protein phosphatase 2C domain-containing protein [Nitrospira sp.]|nr:protein phosphatase 2C domain-containing protein [Nitrospira sp.]
MKKSPRWLGVGRTETGHVRSTNQDVFAAINSCNFWIVADGMGGHPAGDVAAHLAVDAATQRAKALLADADLAPKEQEARLTETIIAGNRAIHERIREEPALKGMGTTVVAMTIAPTTPPVAYIAHLGDSRAYLFHAGRLRQLTRDHTLVAVLLERGLINDATARAYPDRHVLAKGLGMGLDMMPDLTTTALTLDDVLVLCSDGLTKMLDDADIASILARTQRNPRRASHDLVEEALARGGEDNVTVIVCAYTTPAKAESLAIDKTVPAM